MYHKHIYGAFTNNLLMILKLCNKNSCCLEMKNVFLKILMLINAKKKIGMFVFV